MGLCMDRKSIQNVNEIPPKVERTNGMIYNIKSFCAEEPFVRSNEIDNRYGTFLLWNIIRFDQAVISVYRIIADVGHDLSTCDVHHRPNNRPISKTRARYIAG